MASRTAAACVEDLAEAGHVSVNPLTRFFELYLLIAPQRGVDPLQHAGLNGSQIAARVGLATPFH